MTYTEWAILMAALGIVLLVAEFLLPTHGVLGVGGIAAIVAALVFCFLINQWLGLVMLVASAIATPFVFALALSMFPRTPAGKMMLLGPVDKTIPPLRVQIGQVGVTISELRPMGTCEFGGERVEVISEYGMIPAGTQVRVVNMNNRRPTVRAEA